MSASDPEADIRRPFQSFDSGSYDVWSKAWAAWDGGLHCISWGGAHATL